MGRESYLFIYLFVYRSPVFCFGSFHSHKVQAKETCQCGTYYIQIEWSSPSNYAGDERAGDYNDETEDEDERSNEHERREKKRKKKGKKKDGATQTSLFASMYTLCPLADEFIDAGGLLLLPSVCGKMGEAEQQ